MEIYGDMKLRIYIATRILCYAIDVEKASNVLLVIQITHFSTNVSPIYSYTFGWEGKKNFLICINLRWNKMKVTQVPFWVIYFNKWWNYILFKSLVFEKRNFFVDVLIHTKTLNNTIKAKIWITNLLTMQDAHKYLNFRW